MRTLHQVGVRNVLLSCLAAGTLLLEGCATADTCEKYPNLDTCQKFSFCDLVYIKNTNRSYEVCRYFDGSSTVEQAPNDFGTLVQPLQAASSSTRSGPSGGTQANGARKLASQTSAPFTTSTYVLDVIDLLQIDPITGRILHSLDLTAGQPGSPSRFAVTPDNRLAVVTNIHRGNQPYVLIVDLGKFAVTTKIAIPEVANAYGIAITPDGKFAYIITQSFTTVINSLYVLDLTSGLLTATIPLSNYSNLTDLVMTPDGVEAYMISAVGGNLRIPVVDTTTNTLADEIFADYYSPATKDILLDGPSYIAMHPDGTRVYLAPMNGSPIFIVNTASHTISNLIQIPKGDTPPAGTAPIFDPSGRYLVVLDGPGAYSLIDTSTDTLKATVPLDAAVTSAAPGGRKVGTFVLPRQ